DEAVLPNAGHLLRRGTIGGSGHEEDDDTENGDGAVPTPSQQPEFWRDLFCKVLERGPRAPSSGESYASSSTSTTPILLLTHSREPIPRSNTRPTVPNLSTATAADLTAERTGHCRLRLRICRPRAPL
ncbi:unnamed protein product, partial [Urochloa humidicola]